MSGAMLSKPSYTQSRSKAAPYVLPPTAHSRATTVADGPVALGKQQQQPQRKLSKLRARPAPAALPVGFQPDPRYGSTLIVPLASERAECDAYLASVQRWWDDVHGEWRRRCARRRARWTKLHLACEASCLPPPEPLVLPPEPQCPTTDEMPLPACVRRYMDALMAMPVTERAVQCRTGVGGHPGLVIARKLLLDRDRELFAESDAELADERKRTMAEAAAIERAKDETGPNGETLATHDKHTEVQKCGGKGQTIKVVTWAPKLVQ